MPCGHPQQIADAHRLEVVARVVRSVLWKKLQHVVVEVELAFGDRQADRRRSETFAQRVQRVTSLGPIRRPPTLCHHVTMSHQHETIHRVDLIDCVNERQYVGRRYSLSLWRAPRQPCRLRDRTYCVHHDGQTLSLHRFLECVGIRARQGILVTNSLISTRGPCQNVGRRVLQQLCVKV